MKSLEWYFKERWEKEININYLLLGTITCIMGVFSTLFFKDKIIYHQGVNATDDLATSLVEYINTVGPLLVICGVGLLILSFIHREQISGIIEDIEIYSMRNRLDQEGSMSGAFFLGIGSISGSLSQQEYYVFYKKGDYGLIKDKIDVENVEVIMGDKHSPSLKTICIKGEEKQFLFVPKNTIKEKIKLET